jgi:hypothetical protein
VDEKNGNSAGSERISPFHARQELKKIAIGIRYITESVII